MDNKRKLLVAGKHTITVDSVFSHLTDDYDVLSTSLRPYDVKAHIDIFSPDVFLICMGNSSQEDTEQYAEIKKVTGKTQTKIVLVADRDIADAVQSATGNLADLVIKRPATVSTIKEKIEELFVGQDTDDEDDLNADEEEEETAENKKVIHGRNGVVPLNATSPETKKTAEVPKAEQAPAKVQKTGEGAATDTEKSSPETDAPRRRILVVDDDPMMLKMIKEQLKEEFDVATAINGKLAINYLANRTADLILLDYQMPDESGADVIKKIRSNPETENIPVLFLTGVTDKNKIREIVQYKPQGYIIKPVSKNKLIATVKQTLENKE